MVLFADFFHQTKISSPICLVKMMTVDTKVPVENIAFKWAHLFGNSSQEIVFPQKYLMGLSRLLCFSKIKNTPFSL